jgi:hypothetical protein
MDEEEEEWSGTPMKELGWQLESIGAAINRVANVLTQLVTLVAFLGGMITVWIFQSLLF